MGHRLLSLLLPAMLLCACAEPPRIGVPIGPVSTPAWFRGGNHPDFPHETHLAAYAMSSAPGEARAAADAQLEAMIARYALSLGASQLENTRFKQMVTGAADWLSLAEFGEAVRRDSASDGFECACVSAVAMQELRFRAKPMLAPAREKLRAVVAPPEIDDAAKRVEAWGACFVPAARVLALSLLAGEFDRDAHARAEAAAVELYEMALKMDVTQGGADQAARILGGCGRELNLSALFHGRMPAGFKLSWNIEAPAGGVLSGFTEFNLTGQAYCRILSLASTGHELACVRCIPDLDTMAGRKMGIAPLAWRWHVGVPARGNVLLSMNVSETLAGKALKPEFSNACIEWARLNELALADDQAPNALQKFRYRVQISGAINVDLRKGAGTLVARATGEITLKDLETDNVVFRYAPAIVLEADENSDPAELSTQAQREAAGDTLLEIGARLLALFPALKEQ